MIEGIKVTIDGNELVELCNTQVDHHEERAAWYAQRIQDLKEGGAESHNYTSGDPIKNLEDSKTQHENNAAELSFIALHIDVLETYLLSREDLFRLGVMKSRY